MPRNVTVYFADGSRHEYQGVPDDASPEQIAARANRDFQGKQIRHLERAPAAAEPERTLGGYTKEAFKGLIPGLVGMGETVITGAASLLPEGAEQAVRKPVEEFATGVRETFAPAPGYEDTLVRKISEGVGSTVPFLGLGVLGAAGRVAAAGLGVGVGAGEARQKAEEAGATEDERGLATALGTIPGALESLPPIRILRRFGFDDDAIKEVAGVAPALGRIAKAGGEEALQEASSQVLQNLIAKGVYAPDEAVFGGVGEAATVGGGAGAVVSAIAELALGRRLRGPEAEAPGTEEAPDTEEDLTPEQLAPKTGRTARPSPVRAKTLDELRGQIPAAPVVPKAKEEEKVLREPMVFERTKEPTPEALQEAAEFVAQFPEGSKNFNLFKAKSIAKKLGYENIPQKGVGRVDIEPLLRMAVAPQPSVATEAVPAVEAVVEAPPVETARPKLVNPFLTPEALAQTEPVGLPEPAPAVDVLADKEVRPPSDDVYEVASSNFSYPRMIGNQTVPIEELKGGVALDQANEVKRVDALASQIASDKGYFSRIIVDQDNNVVEGQHRLEALRQLGAKEVPVYKIEDMSETFPVTKMEAAVQKAQPMRDEQASQIVKQVMDTIAETGSVQGAYAFQIPGFQKGYRAALNVIEPEQGKAAPPITPPEAAETAAPAETATLSPVPPAETVTPTTPPAAPEVAAPSKSGAFAFEPENLEALRVPEYKSREKLIELPIDDFLAMAKPGHMKAKEVETSKLLKKGTKFSSIPFLMAYAGKDGTFKVEGHEGRHRALALKKAGYETMPVVLKTHIRWSEQTDPKKFDYVAKWPTAIVSEDGTKTIPMPVSRDQALVPYTATPITPPEAPSEPVSTRAGEAVVGATAGSPALPVQRGVPAGREVAESGVSGVEPARGVAERVNEREGAGTAALELELKKLQGRDTISVNKYNEYVQQYKVADETQRAKLRPIIEKLMLERRQILGQAQKINQQIADVEQRAQAQAKFEPMPVGTRIGMIGYESSNDSYWEKVGDNKWQRTLGGRTDDIFKTSAEIDGGRILPPASTTRIFESIDILNRIAPDLTEQAGERAPSLRTELKKAKQDYDDGVLTGDQLAETTGNLLLKTQKQRIVQPRKRGADYIRERLMNARRNGFISKEGIDLAEWFIRQNPLLVADLGISIRNQPKEMEGTAGFYNDISRVINLFKGAGDSQTATHEILHHLERLMPANIRSGILKAYVKQLTKAKKNAKTDAEKTFFSAITNYHYFTSEAKNAEYKKAGAALYGMALDAIQKGKVPKSFYQYVNPSEFWAVNGARIVQGRYGIPPGIVGQIKRWLRDFLEKAKDVFGLKSDAAIIRALDSLAKADGKYQTDRMLVEAPGYRAVEPIKTGKPKKPKPTKPKKSLGELRREASAKMMKPGVIRQVINKLTSPETNYETVAKNFQNVNRKVKKIQNDLKAIGKLVYVGDDKNNIDDQLSAAANRGSYIVATEVEPVAKRLRESLVSYARVMEGTIKDALEKADGYRIALHEQERRETKYLRNVPLNNTTKMEFLPGEPAMTAADARAALETRRSLAKDKEQAEAIQGMIRYLVANYTDPLGYSPVKAQLEAKGKEVPLEMATDFYDDIYNVIGAEYTQEELDATREEYEELDAETRAAVDQVFADLDALHELNKNLNRRANYWTDKVDRVVESYGWKYYAPFKGNPRADKTLDTDTEYLSGELSEAPQSFEGRRTEFDSPILQSIAESYFAASRAGRGTDVTQTIKNLTKLGVIKTKNKRPVVFSFEERNAPDFDYSQVQGRDKVLHYNEDGSVEVFKIENPDVLEAIKTPFKEMNLAVKIGNNLTSLFGQLHTRYNPAFPPMDFIRNSITNAGLISAREGGKEAREYLTAVAANVARNGLWKSGKLSFLLSNNKNEELDKLAKESPFYRDALEMMKYGGRTMYRMSFNISDTMEELKAQVGPKKIINDPSLFTRLVDAYNDAFELTSRVAAYTVRKNQNIAEAKNKGLNVNDPKVMEDINKEAAAFALSLMDFRKIGKYGREMGAWFMFIRPAATGAVDAIDALRPGFTTPQKAFARLEPEVQELFEAQGLAQEIERIKGNKRPDKKKIAALEQEIVDREKAFDAFEKRQLTRAKTARNTAMFTVAMGAALYGMAAAVAGDDDEGRNRVTTDDMSRWTRYLRMPVIGDKGFFQIPWGFGVSALASAGAQVAALANGQSSFKDFAGNMVEIGMDSFLPIPTSRISPFESAENFGAWLLDSATPSVARPWVELVLNVDAMGNPIYNSRAGKYADAFSGSTRPSEIHREISELIFNTTDGEVSISPDTIAFLLNNYADAPNHLAENSFNLSLTLMGDKNFDAKKDTFLLRSFIGRNSNYDARQFAEAEKGIKKLSQQLKTFEDLGTPEQVNKFYRKNPNADILVDTYNKGRGQLSKLEAERRQILLDRSLTPKQREDFVQSVQIEINYLKKLLVEDFKAYSDN